MFAHRISVQLRPDCFGEFNRIVEQEILPLLREQNGFQDVLALLSEDGTQAVGITLWQEKKDAEAYEKYTHPAVLRYLAAVMKGTPVTHSYVVSYMTLPSTGVHRMPPVSFLAGNHAARP